MSFGHDIIGREVLAGRDRRISRTDGRWPGTKGE